MSKIKFTSYEDYIESRSDFAQPILNDLRALVNEACPEVEEEFKWGFPSFTYKKNILCHMAAFKEHVNFGFWLGSIMDDPEKILVPTRKSGMGNLGKLKTLEDLPSKEVLIRYIIHAADLVDQGKKLQKKNPSEKIELVIPEILSAALTKNDKAHATFEAFSYSGKKEYAEWISSARTEETATNRLRQSLEWLEEGKPRNWKYMKR